MSEITLCPHCQAENPLGSKFCNNCGNIVPPSTSILCPSCQTTNPRNRLYCDNCGTRLVKSEAIPSVPPPVEEPSTTPIKRFDLPSRAPGDTSDLDPTAVPDWLRTGEDKSDADIDLPPLIPEEKIPESLHDLQPFEKTTDELPGWLVEGEEDVEALFGAPREITTDHFLELVQEGEEEVDELDEDDDEVSGWLSGEPLPITDEAESDDWLLETDFEADSDDWLTDLGEPASASPVTDESDWLFADDMADSSADLSDETQAETALSWLDEEDESETAVFADTDQIPEPADEADELPDWLTNMAPTQPDPVDSDFDFGLDFDEPTIADRDDDDEALEPSPSPDWLDDLQPAYTDPLAETEDAVDLDEFIFTESPVEVEATAEELPDWLRDFGPDNDESPTTAVSDDPFSAFGLADDLPNDDELDDELPSSWTGLLDEPDDSPDTAVDSFDFSPLEADTSSDDDEFLSWTGTLDTDSIDADIAETDPADTPTPDNDADFLAWADELNVTETDDPFDFDDLDTSSDSDDAISDDGFLGWTSELDETAVDANLDFSPLNEIPDDGHEADDFLRSLANDEEDSEFDLGSISDSDFSLLDSDAFNLAEATADEPEELDDAAIPDWVSQLGSLQEEEKIGTGPLDDLDADDESDLARNEDLPSWISHMMPAADQEGLTLSGLAAASQMPDYDDPLSGLSDDLASTDLPDWLHSDSPLPGSAQPGRAEADDDVPGWLQQDTDDETSMQLSAELSNLLGPPVRDQKPDISQAEIPDWLEALKPTELTGEEPEVEPVTSGPFSGIKGPLAIEPPIARSRTTSISFLPFAVSEAQQQQTDLLQQVLAQDAEMQPVVGAQPQPAISTTTRLLLTLGLLVTILIGLFGPGLFTAVSAPTPTISNLHTAIDNAAGQPVLLVFDYTPTLAGELDPQAQLILQQLAANNSRVVSLSQYTAGERGANLQTAVSHPNNREHLGYLPGEAIGIRQLGYCLTATPLCNGLVSRGLTTQQTQLLADISLVIILTGERTNLVNWVEQLTPYPDLILIAGVTQSLQPVAAPYVTSGQLTGVLAGIDDAVTYQSALLGQPAADDLLAQQNAQSMAQLLVAFLLLAGLFVYARRTS